MVQKIITFNVALKSTERQWVQKIPEVYTNDLGSVSIQFNITDCTDTELTGSSAIVLLKMRDGSFFQGPSVDVERTLNVFSYTLKENEGNHDGLAEIQLIVTISGKEFATQKYQFKVNSGLDSEVAREIMIYDWTTLTAEARAYIDQFTADEMVRDAEFDNNEFDRNAAFSVAQTNRTNQFNELAGELTSTLEAADANITEFDIALKNGIIGENIAAELQKLEETYAPDLFTVKQQLEQKITKGQVSVADIDKNLGGFDETYMSDTFLQQMAGTTPIGSVPADYSLTNNKFAFPVFSGRASKNLFNKDLATIGKSVKYTTGELADSANYAVSDFIPVLANTAYVRTRNTPIAFYNSAKVYISGIVSGLTFVTPADTAFTRINVDSVAYLPTEQLELGTVSTPYESYGTKLPEGIVTREKLASVLKNELLSQIKFGENPVYQVTNPWAGSVSGTSTMVWASNSDSSFAEGDNYLSLTRGDTNIAGIILSQAIPVQYGGLITKKIRMLLNYNSNVTSTLKVYQRKLDGFSWANPNTFVTVTLPSTGGVDATVEAFIPILWDGYFIVPMVSVSVAGTLKIGSVKYTILGNETILPTGGKTVTVKASGGDYTSIQAAIDVAVATKESPVDVLIYPGTYAEELTGKHWVNLTGVDRDTCIVSPVGDSLDVVNHDILKGHFNMTVKNLTLSGEHVKYCIHDDSGFAHVLVIENCVIDKRLSGGYGSAIGLGLRGDQHVKIKNCIVRGDDWGIYYHNWNDQTAYGSLEIENSRVEGTNKYGLYAQSLGSDMTDLIILKGNKFVGGLHDIRVGRQTGYGHNQDDIVFLASGNEIDTIVFSEGASVPFEQPIVGATTVSSI